MQFQVAATLVALASFTRVIADGVSGVHTELLRWCGKPYMPGSPNYDPTGELYPPTPASSPMLYAQVDTLHNIYVSSEQTGTFIVNMGLSLIHGVPYDGPKFLPFEELHFSIGINGGKILTSGIVTVNTTSNLYDFDLRALAPQMTPYDILLTATTFDGKQTFTASTELYYLPDKTTGSVTKINNLSGGMMFKNNFTNNVFQPLLAYGFYTSCSGYLELNNSNVKAYKDMGFSAVNPICDITDGELAPVLDYMDEINLLIQYDMRGSFQNLTSVAEQVAIVKDHSALMGWYTGDEPDGNEFALNSTVLAYDLIKSLDPYHTVGLVLNCANFFFEEYTAGADYIMEDAYPIGTNMSFNKWGTVCNTTYGDCGCDDCVGSILDVPFRLDNFTLYQEWIGGFPKPEWVVAQAFSGEGYWSRDPTAEEAWAMNALGFNHKAKSVMMWTFPASEIMETAHSQMAKVVTTAPVVNFLTGTQPVAVPVSGHPDVDVAYWVVGQQIMVSVVSTNYGSISGTISIHLPVLLAFIVSQPWGSVRYNALGSVLEIDGLSPLATSMVILDFI